jgi:hypothetical protein
MRIGNGQHRARSPDRGLHCPVGGEAIIRQADFFEFTRGHVARRGQCRQRLVDGLDLAGAFEAPPQAGETADAERPRHEREGMNRRVAEHQRKIDKVRRGERQAFLRVSLETPRSGRWRCHRGKPEKRA